MYFEEERDPMKVQNPLMKRVLYRIRKDEKYGEEVGISGYDMGARMYIVKWLDEKHFILKLRSRNVLCGARGCGMVFPFPTAYYLVEILDEEIPKEWNAWKGYATFTHEMHPGRQRKPAIEKLTQIYEDSKKN